MPSAWESALGPQVEMLHPNIRAYVRTVAPGSVGRGEGIFTEAGCSSPIMRPVLSILARWGIAFPERGRAVPFSIENRGDSRGAVLARRTLRFSARQRVMVDRVYEHRGRVIDALGAGGWLEAALWVTERDGALVARSGPVRVRLAGLWWRIPRAVRPRVELVERWDDEAQSQHVDVRVSMPVLGEIYGYRGWFTYAVVSDGDGAESRATKRSAHGARLTE